jgi:hypothetical protein
MTVGVYQSALSTELQTEVLAQSRSDFYFFALTLTNYNDQHFSLLRQ